MKTTDPGEGYRILSGDEILQAGDEYFFRPLREWFRTKLDGFSVADNGVMVFDYRRMEVVNGRVAGADQRSGDMVPEAGTVSDSTGIR